MIAPPSRWAIRAAHLVSLVVLPSALWRVGLVLGFSMGGIEHGAPVHVTGWEAVYVLGLSVVTEGLALLTLGLVRPWGERFPRRLVLGLAGFGVISLALLWGYAFRDFPNVGEGSDALQFSDAGHVLLMVCYTPLLLWAPLLAAVTLNYARRTNVAGSEADGDGRVHTQRRDAVEARVEADRNRARGRLARVQDHERREGDAGGRLAADRHCVPTAVDRDGISVRVRPLDRE